MTGLLPAAAAGISPLPGVLLPDSGVAADGFAVVFAAAMPLRTTLLPADAVVGGVTSVAEGKTPEAAAVAAAAMAARPAAGARVRGTPVIQPTPESPPEPRRAKEGSLPIWLVPPIRRTDLADGAMPADTATVAQRPLAAVEAGPAVLAPDRGRAATSGIDGAGAASRPEVAAPAQPSALVRTDAPMPDKDVGQAGQAGTAAARPVAARQLSVAAARQHSVVAGVVEAGKPPLEPADLPAPIGSSPGIANADDSPTTKGSAAAVRGLATSAIDEQRDEDVEWLGPPAVGAEPVLVGLPPLVLADSGGQGGTELADRRPPVVAGGMGGAGLLPAMVVEAPMPADGEKGVASTPPPGAAMPADPDKARLPVAGASAAAVRAITQRDDDRQLGAIAMPRALPTDGTMPALPSLREAVPLPVVRKPVVSAAAADLSTDAPSAGAAVASPVDGYGFTVRADPRYDGSTRPSPEADRASAMTVVSERLGEVGIGVDGGAQDLRVRLTASAVATGTMAAEMPRLIAELAASGVRVQSLDLSARPEAPGSAAAGSTAQGQPGGDAPQRQPPPAAVAAMVRDAGASDLVRGDGRRAPSSDRYA